MPSTLTSADFAPFALYLALNSLLLLALAINVGSRRGNQGALEPGALGDAMLTRAIRAHGNFSEYAPIALLILLGLTIARAPNAIIHVFGAGFTFGRILHAVGMMKEKHPNAVRFSGNALTGLTLLLGALALIGYGVI